MWALNNDDMPYKQRRHGNRQHESAVFREPDNLTVNTDHARGRKRNRLDSHDCLLVGDLRCPHQGPEIAHSIATVLFATNQ
jgi:hypothetical protein